MLSCGRRWLRGIGIGVIGLLLVCVTSPQPVSAADPQLADAVDNTALSWTSGGNQAWFRQTTVAFFDGDAAQSGNVPGGQTSWIETTVSGPGLLSFYWKVSSMTAYFALKFQVDGADKASCINHAEFQQYRYTVPAGDHTLRWVYAPSVGGYAGYLDNVEYLPGPAILVSAPTGGETWKRREASQIQWVATPDVGSQVRIELYRDTTLQSVIGSTTDNDGQQKWIVPWSTPLGDNYRIKVTSISQPSVYAFSSGMFSISEANHPAMAGFLPLDGVDDYVQTEDQDELDVGDEPTESFTLESWVNIQDYGINPAIMRDIVHKQNSYRLYVSGSYDYSTMRRTGCIGYALRLASGSWSEVSHCKQPAWAYGWHHIALVYNASGRQVQLYLDGQPLFTSPDVLADNLSRSNDPLQSGNRLFGGVDEMRISGTARYSAAFSPATSPFQCDASTRALWHFDEPEGVLAFHDSCGWDNILGGSGGMADHHTFLPVTMKR